MDRCIENVIEFITNQKRATVTLSQERYITKVKKLAEKHPDKCQIVAENMDGSILAHIPVSWIKIAPPKEMSEIQLKQARLNIAKARSVGRENG